jgi:hypothetical protein
MANDNKYEWDESRLFVFNTLEGISERLRILEDRERDSQKEVAVNKTTVTIFSSISGVVAGLIGTAVVELLIKFVFK